MDRAKILIVDDELIMRESLARWLERDGHQVDTASSGEEIFQKLKETHFDILLLDIKVDGMDALKRVKENDPALTVIMMTAYGSIPSAVEAMKNGAYDYMVKPFEPNTIGLLIEKILENKTQSIENLYLRDLKETFLILWPSITISPFSIMAMPLSMVKTYLPLTIRSQLIIIILFKNETKLIS